MKNKTIRIWMASLGCLFLVAACTLDGDITTEVKGYEADDPMQLALVGYMSNEGVLVEISKALAPFGADSQPLAVPGVKATIFKANQSEPDVELTTTDGLLFYSPPSYRMVSGVNYHIRVTAPSYPTVTSTPQPLPAPFDFDSIVVDKRRRYFYNSDPDSILEYIYGPQFYYDFDIYHSMPDSSSADGGISHTYYSNGERYRKNFHVSKLTTESDLQGMGYLFHFDYSHLSTGNWFNISGKTIEYEGKIYPFRQHIDSVRFYAFSFDKWVEEFLNDQSKYNYSNEPYFSIVRKTPSNLSNGMGVFVGSWCATRTYVVE
jgi:hypothetical protein